MIFCRDLKDAYFQVPVHPDSQPYYLIASNGKVSQCKVLFWPFHCSPSSPGGFSGVGMDSQEGDSAASQPEQLACHSRVGPLTAGTSGAPPLTLSRPGNYRQF